VNSTFSQLVPAADPAPARAVSAALASPPSWESLREYSTLLRGVLDAMPFGIAVLGAGGTLTIGDAARAAVTGRSA
jgi:hypothetical protein